MTRGIGAVYLGAIMLVVKIALGIVLAFVVIGLAQCALALVLLGGIASTASKIPAPTIPRGTGIGLTTAAPKPSSSSFLAPGNARIRLLVLDASTLQAVSGVCVTVNTSTCDPTASPHTDASGRLTLDVPAGSSTYYFSHLGYITQQRSDVAVPAGASTDWQVSLRRSP